MNVSLAACRSFLGRAAMVGSLVVGIATLTAMPVPAEDVGRLRDFADRFCSPAPYLPAAYVHFAPVEEVSHAPGFGKYRLRSGGYAGATYNRDSGEPLTFVSRLDRPATGQLPHHLSHVISVPRPGKEWDGLFLDHERALQAGTLARDVYEFLLASSSLPLPIPGREGRYLVFNLAATRTARDQVLTHWETLVGSAFMQQVVRLNQGYDHQFYYVAVPASPALVRPGGWLHPSQREFVPAWGLAFGFVLDDAGACVGRDTIEILP